MVCEKPCQNAASAGGDHPKKVLCFCKHQIFAPATSPPKLLSELSNNMITVHVSPCLK